MSLWTLAPEASASANSATAAFYILSFLNIFNFISDLARLLANLSRTKLCFGAGFNHLLDYFIFLLKHVYFF